jgi:hypothetical protein
MGGARHRRKDDRCEREIVELHRQLDVHCERYPYSGATRFRGSATLARAIPHLTFLQNRTCGRHLKIRNYG